jgi:hypothetical protein
MVIVVACTQKWKASSGTGTIIRGEYEYIHKCYFIHQPAKNYEAYS